MKMLLLSLNLFFVSMAAHAQPEIKQIRCLKPGTSTVVAKLDRVQETPKPLYAYKVSMAGDGRAFAERSILTITEVKNGIIYFEVSRRADADSFSLNSKTGEGWISLIEFDARPFEFAAKCKAE